MEIKTKKNYEKIKIMKIKTRNNGVIENNGEKKARIMIE